MKQHFIVMGAILLMVISMPLALAEQADYDADDFKYEGDIQNQKGMDEVKSKISTVIGIVQYVALGIAIIALMVVGIQFMGANDPHQKKKLADKIKYILLGLVIVGLSFPIVNLIA